MDSLRLNLLLNNPGDARSGYLNVDPSTPDGDTSRVRCDLNNLEPVVDANEVAELVAHDVLSAYPPTEVDKVLDHWLSRLAHKGTVTISVVDVREVARGFMNAQLSLGDLNNLLYGEDNSRRCTLTMTQLSDVLESKGLKVLSRRFNNYRAVITCERP